MYLFLLRFTETIYCIAVFIQYQPVRVFLKVFKTFDYSFLFILNNYRKNGLMYYGYEIHYPHHIYTCVYHYNEGNVFE
jgi:hypothetical protein